jgi:dCTP deaminase
MILTGPEIERLVADGQIVITPFNPARLNPNSYNLSLGNKLLVYKDHVLDMAKKPETYEVTIPDDGLIIFPGELYLGQTAEYTETHRNLVPMLEGRSSIGRLGMFIHITAGFGDTGFCGYWTLEIMVVKPLKIYPGVEVGQIYYHLTNGDIQPYTRGKYNNNTGIQPSRLYQELGHLVKDPFKERPWAANPKTQL